MQFLASSLFAVDSIIQANHSDRKNIFFVGGGHNAKIELLSVGETVAISAFKLK